MKRNEYMRITTNGTQPYYLLNFVNNSGFRGPQHDNLTLIISFNLVAETGMSSSILYNPHP